MCRPDKIISEARKKLKMIYVERKRTVTHEIFIFARKEALHFNDEPKYHMTRAAIYCIKLYPGYYICILFVRKGDIAAFNKKIYSIFPGNLFMNQMTYTISPILYE